MAPSVVKVAAICGSLRDASFNRGLVRAAIELSKSIDGLEIELLDISELPMINTDLEGNGTFPPVVEAFRAKVLAADSILFASPEYNYSIATPAKNAIDWASRPPNVFADKAAAMVSAGGLFGGARGQYHLRQIGIFLDIHFINKPEFHVFAFQQPPIFNFANGDLISDAVKEQLKEVLVSLKAFTLRLQGRNNILVLQKQSEKDSMPTEEGMIRSPSKTNKKSRNKACCHIWGCCG